MKRRASDPVFVEVAWSRLIAVVEQVRNPGAKATDVDQPSPLPQGVSELAVAEPSYASGAEPGLQRASRTGMP